MYLPSAFKETKPEVLYALMRSAPFATLVIPTAAGLEANPLPFSLRVESERALLVGHVARANPVWQMRPTGEALAIFGGPHGYVSPSGYPSKAEHGKVVPTWNYVTVHAHGTLRWIEDDAWLATLLEELTATHEAGRTPIWRASDAPRDFTAKARRAIVGVELRVTRLEGKLKLSQNRSLADRAGVVSALRERGDAESLALADAMQVALAATSGA